MNFKDMSKIEEIEECIKNIKDNDCIICLHKDAMIRYSEEDVGIDLSNRIDTRIYPNDGRNRVFEYLTGVKTYMPDGFFAIVCPRSSMYLRTGLILSNMVGIIDPSYRGEIKAYLVEIDNVKTFAHFGHFPVIKKHTRLLQLIFIPLKKPIGDIMIIRNQDVYDNFDKIFPSKRGSKGYGSTGR